MVYRSWIQVVLGTTCLLMLLSGCSSTSFVGRQYDNFTAYYNGFYNARQAFQEGQQSLTQSNKPVERDTYMSLFAESGSSSGNLFQEAIEKSADLLRNHPQSKWADDALLLIGKSYFYQENYVGAEQKFREVITLSEVYSDEARFWLARTLLASQAYGEAVNLIQERLAEEDNRGEWVARMQLVLGQLYVRRQEWEQAAAALEQGLEHVDENRLSGRAQFLLGQVYETQEAYAKAIQAYERVQRHNPFYELRYAAQVSYVRVLGLHENPQKALQVLASMQRDDKHYNKRSELRLLQARIFQAMGQPYEALALYEDILYGDERLGQGGLTQKVHYRLGELYRDQLDSYEVAAAHFDSAATGSRTGRQDQEMQYAPNAVTDVAEQARVYQAFAQQLDGIARMDSLLYLGSLEQEAFDSTVAAIQLQQAREAREQARQREEQVARENFRSQMQNLESERSQGGSNSQSVTAVGGDAGFLFHNDPVQLQQNIAQFQLQWGERPLVPNWRRQSAIRGSGGGSNNQPVASASSDSIAGKAVDAQIASFLSPVDTSAVPRTPDEQARMLEERAQAWYRLGNTLFLQMNRPDSAATWYQKVITYDQSLPVAQRAYYALAELYRAQGDTADARRLYQQLIDTYPNSTFAQRARENLYGKVEDDAEAAAQDSLVQAQEAYKSAYQAWQEKQAHEEAVDRMLAVARTFPETAVAPRALLAAGHIYLEWARQDSLDPKAAIPLEEPSFCCSSLGSLAAEDTLRGGEGAAEADQQKPQPDTLFAQPLYLESLYTSIVANYPQTPYAKRARELRAVVAAQGTAPDSLVRDSGAVSVDSSAAAPAAANKPSVKQKQPPSAQEDNQDKETSAGVARPKETNESSGRSPVRNRQEENSAGVPPDTLRPETRPKP